MSEKKKQQVVRTYEVNYSGYQNNPCGEVNCDLLNSYLNEGYTVVMVTPKDRYNEYVVEKVEKDAKLEKVHALLKQWLQTTHAGGCDNVNLAAETEQFLAGDL